LYNNNLTNNIVLSNISFKIENLKIFKIKIFNTNIETNFLLVVLLIFLLFINIFLFYIISQKRKKEKKPLVYTKRAIRLKVFYIFIYIIILLTIYFIFYFKIISYFNIIYVNSKLEVLVKLIVFYIFFSFIILLIYYSRSFIMLLSTFFIFPLEQFINNKFYFRAKEKIERLKKNNLKVIGITGSYGKTSTKFYIEQVLKKKYNVLVSKLSYNTPMGLSKTINEDLNENHNIFVAEMGARYKNDIAELIELVKPEIGVLTEIGQVHLETFKSIENIVKEKFKIIINSKIGFLNIDNDYIYEKLNESLLLTNEKNIKNLDKNIPKIIKLVEDQDVKKINVNNFVSDDCIYIFTYGFNKERNPYFLIDNIFSRDEKTIFEIYSPGSNSIRERFCFETNLLGKHSVQNLTVAIGIGFLFGVQYSQIYDAVANILPVEHRLQIIKPNDMLTIIDDAFNSNPDSAIAAIEVIKQFNDMKKIIITPGFIELGKIQYEKNYQFGKQISENFDFAIFVGKTNKDALIEGFTSLNNNKKYYYSKNLEDATSLLPSLIDRKTVVLFENDLPDNYEG
ncbi:MAG: Mur ligase family protein, partial [Exilispira sp.]